MTTTQKKQSFGPIMKTAKFAVTADNDVLLSVGHYLILGAVFTGLATALNTGAGADIVLPGANIAGETVCVTATGAGTVELVFLEVEEVGFETFDT